MRKHLIISISFFASFILTAEKCSSPEKENSEVKEIQMTAALDSINMTFKADYLSETMLRALEVKARQKLMDFADYFLIYTKKSLDKSFKVYAGQMISALFYSDSAHINIRISNTQKAVNPTISEFLEIASESDADSLAMIIDSLNICEPLHNINDTLYAGDLAFSHKIEVSSGNIRSVNYQSGNKVAMIVTKVGKSFGNDTLRIWKVSLGDIR